MSPKPARLPAPDPPFWQLDLDEQIRRARAYIHPVPPPPMIGVSVMDLVDFKRAGQTIEDQITNLVYGGRAFGQAEAISFSDAEFLHWLGRRRGSHTTKGRR